MNGLDEKIRWKDSVSATVARKETDPNMTDRTTKNLVGRFAPRRFHGDPLRIVDGVDGVEARSADNTYGPLAHAVPLPVYRVRRRRGD